MTIWESTAATEIANRELRMGKPFDAAQVRAAVFNNPADPGDFEWMMVPITGEIRTEASRIRDMKKSQFEKMSDDEIKETLQVAGTAAFVAYQKEGNISSFHFGGNDILVQARMILDQPQFLTNEFFEKDMTTSPLLDTMIALKWRCQAVFAVMENEKKRQIIFGHNATTIVEPATNAVAILISRNFKRSNSGTP